MEKQTLTLRIKKKYFDLIKSGEKKFEYRNATQHYSDLFKGNKYKFLKLHYQGKEKLKVEIINIRKVKTPKRLKENKKIIFGDKVFRIKLGNIL